MRRAGIFVDDHDTQRFAAAKGDRQCGLKREMVSKYETGVRPRVGARNLRYLVGALRPTLDDLRLLLGGDPPKGLADLAVDLEEERTNRRNSLKLGLTAAGSLLLPRGSREPFPPTEQLTVITDHYRRLDRYLPSWKLIEPATTHLRFLDGLYRDTSPSTYRRGLAATVSEAAGFAAWLSCDMDDPAAAEAHYRRAIRAAGEPMLGGYMHGSMSWLAAQLGDGATALELIQGAKSKIGPIGSATSSAWLAVHEALAQATLGHTFQALTLLDRGADATSRAVAEPPVWPWLYPFSLDKLAAFSGSCHLRLGRARDARRALDEALRLRPAATRERATILIDLANTHLIPREPEVDEICQLLSEGAGIAVAKGSARLWRQMRDTRTRLQPWASSRSIRELDDRLGEYST